jgi:hypothetical protein
LEALIGMMVYSFARVGAAVAMKGGDLFQQLLRSRGEYGGLLPPHSRAAAR